MATKIKKEKTVVKSIQIIIETNDHYDHDAFIQTKAGIRKVIKENPMIERLVNGQTAY